MSELHNLFIFFPALQIDDKQKPSHPELNCNKIRSDTHYTIFYNVKFASFSLFFFFLGDTA